jgi:hypothetical protein
MATSATGGYLNETETAFNVDHFFHDLIMGLTGIDKTLVRPRWQPAPPVMPLSSVGWCGFGVTTLNSDDSAYLKESSLGDSASLIRYERYSLLCSFYGLGASNNARKMRDSLEIGQNREVLFLNGLGYVTCTPSTHAPELINDVWYDRYDIEFQFVREISKSYNVLSIIQANVGSEISIISNS